MNAVLQAKEFLNEHGYNIEPSIVKGFDWFIPVPDDEYDENIEAEQAQGTHVTNEELLQLAKENEGCIPEPDFYIAVLPSDVADDLDFDTSNGDSEIEVQKQMFEQFSDKIEFYRPEQFAIAFNGGYISEDSYIAMVKPDKKTLILP